MSNSREKILAAARLASSVENVDPSKNLALEESIAAAINAVTPLDREGLVKQFAAELENVSAEFHHVGTHAAAAQKVQAIMRECDSSELAITGETETIAVTRQLAELDQAIESVNALDLVCAKRKTRLATIATALTTAAFAIADMGSLVFLYDRSRTSQPYFLSDCVIALVSKSDLVANHFDLLEKLDPVAARNMVLVTGPSRTADIEKILILGAHGPRRLVILLLDG